MSLSREQRDQIQTMVERDPAVQRATEHFRRANHCNETPAQHNQEVHAYDALINNAIARAANRVHPGLSSRELRTAQSQILDSYTSMALEGMYSICPANAPLNGGTRGGGRSHH